MNHKKRKHHDDDRTNSGSETDKRRHKYNKDSKGPREMPYYKRSPYKHSGYRYMNVPEYETPDMYGVNPFRYFPVSPRHEARVRYDYYHGEDSQMPVPHTKKTKRFFLKKKKDYISESSDSDSSISDVDSVMSAISGSDEDDSGSSESDNDAKNKSVDKNKDKSVETSSKEGTSQKKALANTDSQQAGTSKEDKQSKKGAKKRKRKGKWQDDQKSQLVHAYRQRLSLVRGKFVGGSGGKKRRKQAWKDISGEVSDITGGFRSVAECKKKIAGMHGEARKKNRILDRTYNKSGAGAIPPDEALTDLEVMIIKYLGEEPTTGIPNVARAPVRPGDEEFLKTPDLKVNRTSQPQEPAQENTYRSKKQLIPEEGTKSKPVEVSSSTHSEDETGGPPVTANSNLNDNDLPDIAEGGYSPMVEYADSPAKPGIRIAVDDTMNVQYQPYYTPEKLQMEVPKKGYKGIKNAATHKDTPKEAPKIEPPTDVPGIASTTGVIKIQDLTLAKQNKKPDAVTIPQEYNYFEDAKYLGHEYDDVPKNLDLNNNVPKLPTSSLGLLNNNQSCGDQQNQESGCSDASKVHESDTSLVTMTSKDFMDLLENHREFVTKQNDVIIQCTEALKCHKEHADKLDNVLHKVESMEDKMGTMSNSIGKAVKDLSKTESETQQKDPCWYCGFAPTTKPKSYLEYCNKQNAVMYQMYTHGQELAKQQNTAPNSVVSSDGGKDGHITSMQAMYTPREAECQTQFKDQSSVTDLAVVLQGNSNSKGSTASSQASSKSGLRKNVSPKVSPTKTCTPSEVKDKKEPINESKHTKNNGLDVHFSKNGNLKPKVHGKLSLSKNSSVPSNVGEKESETGYKENLVKEGVPNKVPNEGHQHLTKLDTEIVGDTGSLTLGGVYGIEATEPCNENGVPSQTNESQGVSVTEKPTEPKGEDNTAAQGKKTGVGQEKKRGRPGKDKKTQRKNEQAGSYCTRSHKKPE